MNEIQKRMQEIIKSFRELERMCSILHKETIALAQADAATDGGDKEARDKRFKNMQLIDAYKAEIGELLKEYLSLKRISKELGA